MLRFYSSILDLNSFCHITSCNSYTPCTIVCPLFPQCINIRCGGSRFSLVSFATMRLPYSSARFFGLASSLLFSCGVTMAQLVTPWPFQCHPPFPQNLALSHNWLKRDTLCSVFLVPTGPFLFRLLAIPAPWRHLCNKWRKLRG